MTDKPLSSNSTQVHNAEQRREQFAELLREMFQLNQPELDFGLYRIMHARKDDINRFIERDLPRITRSAFANFASSDKAELQRELDKAIAGAQALEVDPDTLPKVQQLKAQLNDGFDLAREEGEVYDALVTFFNRYYDEGDFLSRRVYKNGTYAIPYQGEEVVLHWANKDQYYIKSSETLRDYSFRLNPNTSANEPDPLRVHFKLVDAEAGAQNNNKESDSGKRVFILDAEQPFELIDGEPNEDGQQFPELQIRFVFRAATQDDWNSNTAIQAELAKATAAAKKKPPVQGVLVASATAWLLSENSGLPEQWRRLLAQPYTKANGEQAEYSRLQGQLNNYTKKNSFDYFIHKDLGGFLNRELDFYIKNELLDWADLATLKNNPTRLAPLLSKIEVIRKLGESIIAFLAQLENFQKKLWLKKKFVTETNYCITLDRLAEHSSLLEQVFASEAQLQDWQNLYQLDLAQLEKDHAQQDWPEFLDQPQYRYLMLDTRHFDEGFKAQLLATIDDLDAQCDGLLVHSENFQALNLLQERYRERVKCIYIDPPYNTGSGDFYYKDQYQNSSWLTALSNSTQLSRTLLRGDSAFVSSIDDNEVDRLRLLLSSLFGEGNRLADIVWQKRYSPDARTTISDAHEYLLAYSKNYLSFSETRNKLPLTKSQTKQFSNPDNDARGSWKADNFTAQGYRPNQMYEIKSPAGLTFTPPPGRCWIVTEERFRELEKDGRMYFGRDGTGRPAVKRFLKDMDGMVPWTWWPYEDVGHSQDGMKEGLNLFGPGNGFVTQKPVGLIKRVFQICSGDSEIVLDYFAGSGTAAHAVLTLQREQELSRKYLLVESGSHFYNVVTPKVKKVAYAENWKAGVPVADSEGSFNGVSHCFKYVRLESFEDTLGNLALHRGKGQQELLQAHENSDLDAARQSYVMNYLLEVETRGSASLLNTKLFTDPTAYQLDVRSASGDETKAVNVDLMETFNYLLGLTVEHIAAPIWFDAEVSQSELGRWQAEVSRINSQELAGKSEAERKQLWWFRTVYGTNPAGQKVLVVWRNMPSIIAGKEKGQLLDNAVLDAVLIEKLNIRLTQSADDEVDILYVNGDHNIAIPKNRRSEPMTEARVQLIEEAFHRLMFAGTEAVEQ